MEASSKIIPIILCGQGVCGLLQTSLLALEGARWIGVNGGAAAAMPWCPAIRAADELRRCVVRIAMLVGVASPGGAASCGPAKWERLMVSLRMR